MVQKPKAPLFDNQRHADAVRLGCDVALGEYFPTFRRCVVLSFTGSITARGQDVECLIQMEALRYFETSGNVYRPTSEVKGKVHSRTGHEGPVVKWYSSTHSLTSAIDRGGWSTPRPGRFTPAKDPVSIVQEAGWVSQPVLSSAENLAPHRDSIPGPSSP